MPFQIVRNDITKVKADAIVNTANPAVTVGPGVDTAIYNAAGRDWLLDERAEIGNLEVGSVAVTPAGDLDAKIIIHESGPVWIDGSHNEAQLLRQCYDKCLERALKYKCESIAFPLLASGAYRFPKDLALRIAIDAFSDFLSEHEMDILLVVYDDQSFRLSETMFDDVKSFVDSRYIEAKLSEPIQAGSNLPEPILSAPMPAAENRPEQMSEEQNRPAPMPAGSAQAKRGLGHLFKSEQLLKSDSEASKSVPLMQQSIFKSSEPAKPAPGSFEYYVENFENQDVLTFGEYLQQMINKKGMTNKSVYLESGLSKQYFSKLLNNKVALPAKEKILSIAVTLKLNLDETKDFLLHAGYALSPYSKTDLVFEYYITKGKYCLLEISAAMVELGIEGGLWPNDAK